MFWFCFACKRYVCFRLKTKNQTRYRKEKNWIVITFLLLSFSLPLWKSMKPHVLHSLTNKQIVLVFINIIIFWTKQWMTLSNDRLMRAPWHVENLRFWFSENVNRIDWMRLNAIECDWALTWLAVSLEKSSISSEIIGFWCATHLVSKQQ